MPSMSSTNIWLDIREGAAGLESPFLEETLDAYRVFDKFPQEQAEIISFIRGGDQVQEPRYPNHAICMARMQSFILIDCRLHLKKHLAKVKAGPIPGNICRHLIRGARRVSLTKVVSNFYSQILPLLSTVICFSAKEHGGVHNILSELASWIRPRSRSSSHRPLIVIFTESRGDGASLKDLEKNLTLTVLADYNACREYSFSSAEQAWRNCFAGIRTLPAPQDKLTLEDLIRQKTLLTQRMPQQEFQLPNRGSQLKVLCQAACTQFSQGFEEPFNILRASRLARPIPAQLGSQIDQVLARVAKRADLCQPACQLIAAALILDSLGSFWFPPQDIFREFYQPLLEDVLLRHKIPDTLKNVEQQFITLSSQVDPFQTSASQYSQHRAILKNLCILVNCLQKDNLCLSCLAGVPSNRFPCSHRLCDTCLLLLYPTSAQWVLEEPYLCVFCGSRSNSPLYLKPPTAGLRILHLEGPVESAESMSTFLKSLRKILGSPLYHHFDLVSGTGIGLFFIIMIFCEGATIEDCIHHLPKLQYVRRGNGEISFNKDLVFRFNELRTRGTKLLLPEYHQYQDFKSKGIGLPMIKKLVPTGMRHKASQQTPSVNVNEKLDLLWPGFSIDIEAQFPPIYTLPLIPLANQLLALLFYAEAAPINTFYETSSVTMTINIKCRLSAGPHLADLLMRTRLKKVRLYYSGDETPKSVQLCTDESWRAIKSGEDFQQRVHVHIYSPSSLVTLQVDGILETDQLFLSNSPCQAQGLFVSKPSGTKQPRSQTMETIDQIGLLQQCLYPLTI